MNLKGEVNPQTDCEFCRLSQDSQILCYRPSLLEGLPSFTITDISCHPILRPCVVTFLLLSVRLLSSFELRDKIMCNVLTSLPMEAK